MTLRDRCDHHRWRPRRIDAGPAVEVGPPDAGRCGSRAQSSTPYRRRPSRLGNRWSKCHPGTWTRYWAWEIICGRHICRSSGLRFFMTDRDNADVGRRPEFGVLSLPHYNFDAAKDGFPGLHLRTYNVDRGRLENHLVRAVSGSRRNRPRQVQGHCRHSWRSARNRRRTWMDRRVCGCARAGLSMLPAGSGSWRGGWVSGRLGEHEVNAVWFRLDGRIDPDRWTDDPRFHSRTKPDLRWLSTNHLMGLGYWVWLIPLPTGATSVGIMTDPTLHPFDELNRVDRLMAWLAVREPQLASAISAA